MADYRSDISPVEEYLLEQVAAEEGEDVAARMYDKLVGLPDTKPPRKGWIGDENQQKLDHLWEHHLREHDMRGEVTD